MAASEGEMTQLVLALRRYLQAHPRAADSVEGIAAWWIAGARRSGLDVVESALEVLVGEGAMRKQVLPDGKTIYAGTVARAPGKRS
jgi:hypothetical protein